LNSFEGLRMQKFFHLFSDSQLKVFFNVFLLSGVSSLVLGCTFEERNKISRSIQNWTGTNGVVDVFSDGKVMYRFVEVEKLTTATSTSAPNENRPYRFGYGYMDLNQNYKPDAAEKKVYFEVSDYGAHYIFYENPF
jgi:hypothetical protein